MSDRGRVAIVEDDFLIAEYLRDICEEELGLDVVGMAHDADDARTMLEQTRPEWVLMDVRLGGSRDGVDVAHEFHALMPGGKVIFVTGSNEPPTINRINADNPHRILIKPISPEDLAAAFQ